MLIRFYPHCADGTLNQMSPPCSAKAMSGINARDIPQNILEEMEERRRDSRNDHFEEKINNENINENENENDRNKPRRYPTSHPSYTPHKTNHPSSKPSSHPTSSPTSSHSSLPVPIFTAVVTQHASNKNDPYLLATQPLVFPLNPKGSICMYVCV